MESKPQGIEAAKAVRVQDLVKTAEGSIVSRILMKSGQGSVTLFAFDGGQALSEHTAPFDALVQVLEGSVELTIGGVPLTVEAGQSALMPGGVPHSLKAPGRMKMLLTMIKV